MSKLLSNMASISLQFDICNRQEWKRVEVSLQNADSDNPRTVSQQTKKEIDNLHIFVVLSVNTHTTKEKHVNLEARFFLSKIQVMVS